MERIWVLHEPTPEEIRRALRAELMNRQALELHSKKKQAKVLKALGRLLLMPVPYAHLQILLISMIIWLYAYLYIIA